MLVVVPRRALVALVALVAPLGDSGCGDAPAAEAPKPPAPPPAKVEVATVRAGALDDRRAFLGEVRAFLRAEIGAGAAGEVQEVRVR
ncbi:MAG: hypothetical protein KC420_21150, partial [Myxococcales bacterium]|nr:hypothetical protein [Myxococcales bacterium]